MDIEVEEARPVGVFFLLSMGSSLLTRGLVLESFGNLTSNTSKFCSYCSLVYRFTLFASARELGNHS